MAPSQLRYQSGGEVHLDFHGTTYATIHYLLKHFGPAALEEIIHATGTRVYRQMHKKLLQGDASELLAFWRYYFDREKADYSLTTTSDGAILEIRECPAIRHLKKLGLPYDEHFCECTKLLNDAWCDGSPFEIITVKHGPCACTQTLKRKGGVK